MRFSVIIPTFNRPADLERCLAALGQLEFPRDEFEVIVVDDGGRVDLENVVAGYRDQIGVTLLRQANQGAGPARNHGAAHAAGHFLAFIDDDCTPVPEWLGAFDAAATRASDALIGGRTKNGLPANPNSEAAQVISDYFRGHMNRDPERGQFCPSNNIAVAREPFLEIGGFDAGFGHSASEDRDFCDRWLASGRRIVTAADALVLHYRDLSLRGFWKLYFYYGRGSAVFSEARERRSAGPLRFAGWRFHLGLLAAPFRKSLGPRSLHLSMLIVVEQVAKALGRAFEKRARKRQRLSVSHTFANK
jgi:GT2 family glycosyltransferase